MAAGCGSCGGGGHHGLVPPNPAGFPVERYGPSLTADEVAIIQRVGEASDTPFHAEFPEVFSLVHVDYRLDNLMINATGSDIAIIWWWTGKALPWARP